ncbi:MAG: hypothetical protein FJ190_05150 [Gammaproteobacteria bacterium]|nr:hypothetical protein [Gammaproteobacteria bacterium]
MMKKLCLLLILANVALFLWETRESGLRLQATQKSPKAMNTPGVATILLAREAPPKPYAPLPELNQDEQTQPQEQVINKPTEKPSDNGKNAEPKL